MYASREEHTETAKMLLLECNTDINIQDNVSKYLGYDYCCCRRVFACCYVWIWNDVAPLQQVHNATTVVGFICLFYVSVLLYLLEWMDSAYACLL